MHYLKLKLAHLKPHHLTFLEVTMLLLLVVTISSQSAYAADVTRLKNRSLLITSPQPGAKTDYKLSFTYASTDPIGSIEVLFCINPIPDEPCTKPVGFDASNATLIDQTGETGFAVSFRNQNRVVLTRVASPTGLTPSTYTLGNIINSTDIGRSYAARLSTHHSTNASDPLPYVNLGSVLTGVNDGISIATQVPPVLVFCLGQTVSADCADISETNYSDMGELSPNTTLTATSQMAANTNASGGYAITINGTTMQAGTNVIKALNEPDYSRPGTPQFGINLKSNTLPTVGQDPDGSWDHGNPTVKYATANKYAFNDGDIVASSPDVELERRYTVSYIVNSPPTLRAGVYTSTLTYICTGRF